MTKAEFIQMFGEDPTDILGQDWENYIQDYLLDRNLCPDCCRELPPLVREDRGGAYSFEYSENVTYCPCGRTFIS